MHIFLFYMALSGNIVMFSNMNWVMQAEAGGSAGVSRRFTTGQPGVDQFTMKVPNNKVGKYNLLVFFFFPSYL